jgi:hypothetical protein
MEKTVSKTNQIKKYHIALLVVVIFCVGKFFYLPSLIAAHTGRNAFVIVAALCGVEWLLLLAVYVIYRLNPDKNLYEMLSDGIGGVSAKIIMTTLSLFFLARTLSLSAENYNFSNYVTLLRSNYIAYALPLFAVVGFMAYKGLNAIARNCEIFVPLIIFTLVVILALSLPEADIENIMPLGYGAKVLGGVFRFSGWFKDSAMFLMFLGKVRKGNLKSGGKGGVKVSGGKVAHSKVAAIDVSCATGAEGAKIKKLGVSGEEADESDNVDPGGKGIDGKTADGGWMPVLCASIFSCIIVAAFFALFSCVFGGSAPDQTFAIAKISQYGIFINTVGRIDRIAVAIWLFGLFIKLALLLYCALECYMQAYKIKSRKIKSGILILMLALCTVIPLTVRPLEFLITDMNSVVAYNIALSAFIYSLPLLLLVLSLSQKKRGRGHALNAADAVVRLPKNDAED